MLQSVDLELTPNEASDLAEVHEPGLLAAHGWDRAFLTVLDEGPVEDCIAVLGHEDGAGLTEGWSSHRLAFTAPDAAGKTEDAEAVAVRDGRIYVLGSHYGSKTGPLEAKRHFVARFDQSELSEGLEGCTPELTITRTRFRLHRAINDALSATGIELFELSKPARKALVDATIKRGRKKDKGWVEFIEPDDLPLNIEGAAFGPDGTLHIGLRFPTTAEGQPLVVALPDVDVLFDAPDDVPPCGDVWWIETGSPELPEGIRAMDPSRGSFQVITGSLDALGKDSALVDNHPESGQAGCRHHRLGALPAGGGAVEATLVHDFEDLRSVEGVADGPAGHAVYVVDVDARVDMRFLAVD
jgi:hypothetical protein